MRLSLKVEYACRVLAQLARSYGNTELPHIEDLARAEEIPANYLVQILNELRNGGLIVSRRGKQGGYALARPAGDISVSDILRAIDGEVLALNSEAGGESGKGVQRVWNQIVTAFREETDGYSVEDIANPGSEEMYFI